MLRTRLILSAFFIPGFVLLCWLDAQTGRYAPLLFLFALFLTVQSCRELAGLLRLGRGSLAAIIVGCIAILLAVWAWHVAAPEPAQMPDEAVPLAEAASPALGALGPALLTYACVVLVLLFVRAVAFSEPGGHTATLGAEVFAVSYVGVLLATTAELRWIGSGALGYLAIGSLVIGAKVGDIGGYSFGRLFGKRKLAPALSPGKTWAGAVGAVATAAMATALWIRYAGPLLGVTPGEWPHLLVFGAILGLVGLVGDLCESMLKRDAGQKDASHLMPAFGGLLDLIDSILFSSPVALLLWTVWPPAV
jgi:phosphatidate cytidylyltransferase